MKVLFKQSFLAGLIFLPAVLVFCFFGSFGASVKLTPYMVSVPGMVFMLVMNVLTITLIHVRIVPRLEKYTPEFQGISKKRVVLNSAFWLWTGPFAFLVYFLPVAFLRRRFQPKTHVKQFYVLSDLIALLLYIASVITLTLANYIPVRDELLFEYKKRHIAKELMYYREGWGWVDKIHYRQDHFKEVYEAIESDQGSIHLADGWYTPLRMHVRFSVTYGFEKPATELQRWALATAITTHFMEQNERVQGGSPWYHGNQLSAWQFDDVSSGLLACLDLCPKIELRPAGQNVTDQLELQKTWQDTGMPLVGLKMDLDESWNLSSVAEAKKLVDQAQWEILESQALYR